MPANDPINLYTYHLLIWKCIEERWRYIPTVYHPHSSEIQNINVIGFTLCNLVEIRIIYLFISFIHWQTWKIDVEKYKMLRVISLNETLWIDLKHWITKFKVFEIKKGGY